MKEIAQDTNIQQKRSTRLSLRHRQRAASTEQEAPCWNWAVLCRGTQL